MTKLRFAFSTMVVFHFLSSDVLASPLPLPQSCFLEAQVTAKKLVKAQFGGKVTLYDDETSNEKNIYLHAQSSEFDDPIEIIVTVFPEND
jgi:hypothetical protein